MDIFFSFVMLLNAMWFGVAFNFFSLQSSKATKLLVNHSQRNEPLFAVLAHAVQFLGGMNLALSVFAILLLFNPTLFPSPYQKMLFTFVFCLAHGSQFYYNVADSRKESQQKPPIWSVLRGTMFFIFVVDGLLCFLNLLFCIIYLNIQH